MGEAPPGPFLEGGSTRHRGLGSKGGRPELFHIQVSALCSHHLPRELSTDLFPALQAQARWVPYLSVQRDHFPPLPSSWSLRNKD